MYSKHVQYIHVRPSVRYMRGMHEPDEPRCGVAADGIGVIGTRRPNLQAGISRDATVT